MGRQTIERDYFSRWRVPILVGLAWKRTEKRGQKRKEKQEISGKAIECGYLRSVLVVYLGSGVE